MASTTILMGPSGVGKTTVGLQFLAECSDTEPGLMFSFYETPPRLRYKADNVAPGLGPLLQDGSVEMLWQPPTGDLLDAYGARLLEAIHRRGARRLFIDGLTAFKNAAIDPARIGNFLSSLANEFRVLEVTTVYSLEVARILGAEAHVPLNDASALAENIILMRYAQLHSRQHRLVSVLKVRDSQFDPSQFEFEITAAGVEIAATATSADLLLADIARSARRGGPAAGPASQ